ncbi:hypothetical protein CDG79_20035 [Nostoc sp. 'Peltigera membranacea cyanobiont' 232]|nr:hypothetical protein CDG79_20035 [Nostoc sp. 'Peltigera membranacea cyanobiont' 232]
MAHYIRECSQSVILLWAVYILLLRLTPFFLKLEKLVNNLGFWMMAVEPNIQDQFPLLAIASGGV